MAIQIERFRELYRQKKADSSGMSNMEKFRRRYYEELGAKRLSDYLSNAQALFKDFEQDERTELTPERLTRLNQLDENGRIVKGFLDYAKSAYPTADVSRYADLMDRITSDIDLVRRREYGPKYKVGESAYTYSQMKNLLQDEKSDVDKSQIEEILSSVDLKYKYGSKTKEELQNLLDEVNNRIKRARKNYVGTDLALQTLWGKDLYKEKSDISKVLESKRAEEYQNLSSTPEFEQLAKKGAQMKNRVSMSEKFADEVLKGKHGGLENLKAPDGYIRLVDRMTDEEKKTYYAILAKEGSKSADAYIFSLEPELNARAGEAITEFTKKNLDPVTRTAANSIVAMLGDATAALSGIKQWFTDEPVPVNIGQYAKAGALEESKNPVESTAYNIAGSIGGMLPGIAANAMVPGAGTPVFFATAGGQGMAAMLREGKIVSEATAYGLINGALEAGLQAAMGGVAGLGAKSGKSLLGAKGAAIIKSVSEKLSLSPVTRKALGILSDMAGEGAEEYLQEIFDPIVRNLTMGENNEFKISTPEAWYAGLLGALTSGIMNAPGEIISSRMNRADITALGKQVLSDPQQLQILIDRARAFSEGPVKSAAENIESLMVSGHEVSDYTIGQFALAVEAAEIRAQKARSENSKAAVEPSSPPLSQSQDAQVKGITNGMSMPQAATFSESSAPVAINNISQKTEADIPMVKSIQPGTVSVNGAPVAIERISTQNGEATVHLAGGVSIPIDDVSFTSPNEGQIYLTAAQMDINEAKAYISNYNGLLSPERYTQAFKLAYRAGQMGQTFNFVRQQGGVTAALSTDILRNIYAAGRNAGEVTRQQLAAMKSVAREVSRALGVNVKFRAAVEGGKANGLYNRDSKTIEIATYDTDNMLIRVFGHELIHHLKKESPEAYKAYRDFIVAELVRDHPEAFDRRVLEIQELHARQGISLDYEQAVEEIIADSSELMLKHSDAVKRLIRRDIRMAEKVLEFLKKFIKKLQAAFKGIDAQSMGAVYLEKHLDALNEAVLLFDKMLEETASKVKSDSMTNKNQKIESEKFNKSDIVKKYQINPNFNQEYDAWDKKSTGGYFKLGTVSEPLKSIGINPSRIYWDKNKIAKIKKGHPHMTDDIIKQVPDLLENPMIVMQSQTKTNRVVLLGEVFDSIGTPVVAALELTPSGRIRNFVKVASAYGKSNAQYLVDTSDILYINPDKKRTDGWLDALRLQLPAGLTLYGSIGRVTYSEKNVKGEIEFSSGKTGKTAIQLAFEKAEQASTSNSIRKTSKNDTKYSLKTSGQDSVYIELARDPEKNEAALRKMVDLKAKESGYDSPILFHGTRSFGFTKFDFSKADDKISLFLTSNNNIASTYSGVTGSRDVNSQFIGNIDKMTDLEIANALNITLPDSMRNDGYSYVVFTQHDFNQLIKDNEKRLQKLLAYLNNIAVNEKYISTVEQLKVELGKPYDHAKNFISTPLYLLAKHTDVLSGYGISDAAELESNVRLAKRIAEFKGIDKDSLFVRIGLEGYDIQVFNRDGVKRILNTQKDSGNYSLYAKLGNTLTVDGNGALWNNLKMPYKKVTVKNTIIEKTEKFYELKDKLTGEYIEYGALGINPKLEKVNLESIHSILVGRVNNIRAIQNEGVVTTRDIAKYAYDQGYDSVVFKNIKDNGGHNSDVDYDELADIYVIFDNKNVKSADLVTYDDNGNVIPLSERFDAKSEDIRYSLRDSQGRKLSAEQIDYFKDSKVRDENGNLLVMYHGTNEDIGDYIENIFYMSSDKGVAGTYGENVSGYYVKLVNPLIINAEGKQWNELHKTKDVSQLYERLGIDYPENVLAKTRNLEKYAHQWGHDGIIYKNIVDSVSKEYETPSTVVSIYADGQVKSVENLKPTDDSNIRYQIREIDPSIPVEVKNEMLLKELERQSEIIEDLKSQFKITSGHVLNRHAVRRYAQYLVKKYSSEYNVDLLTQQLNKIFTYIANAKDMTSSEYLDVIGVMTDIARNMLEKTVTVDRSLFDQYEDLRKFVRNTSILLNEKQIEDIEYRYDSWNSFRRQNFGRIKFGRYTGTGVSLDSMWTELSEHWPELFNPETNELDQAVILADTIAFIQPRFESGKYNGMTAEDIAQDVALEIFEGYFDIPEVKTFADRKQAELERVKAHYRRRLAELRDKKNQAAEKKIAQIKEEARIQRETLEERRSIRGYRNQVEKHIGRLIRWMNKPTDKQHIPQAMLEIVRDFVTSFDFTSVSTQRTGVETKKGRSFRESLLALESAFGAVEAALNQSDGVEVPFYTNIDPDFISRLQILIDSVKGSTTLNDLNAEQMMNLAYVSSQVSRMITQANELIINRRYKNAQDAGAKSIEQMLAKKQKRAFGGLFGGIDRLLNINMLDSFAYFEQLGEAAGSIFLELRDGFDLKIKRIRQAQEYMQELLDGVDVKSWDTEAHEFNVAPGVKLTLTTAQIMELHNLAPREQAWGHLFGTDGPGGPSGGGITPAPIKLNNRAKISEYLRQTEPVRLTPELLSSILSVLTEEQVRVAEGMQKFMKTVADWGNQASMLMFGYNKFTEEHYWPIRSDSGYLHAMDPDRAVSLNAVRKYGATQTTVEGANNPIVITSAFDTFMRHIDELSSYASLAAPVSDAMQWYNYAEKNKIGYTGSVKKSISHLMGDAGNEFFINLLKDINGLAAKPLKDGISDRAISAYKAAAVGANLRVVAQQPTAYLRAYAMLDKKYLVKGRYSRAARDRMLKNAPIAWWKTQGYYEMDVGRSMRSMIIGDDSITQKLREKALWLAGEADTITWTVLYNAVEHEVMDTHPDIPRDSALFDDTVAKRFREIVDRTQVVDSVFHRSQIMRSKSQWDKMVTSFMSEPMKSYNLLRSAIISGDKKRIGRSFIAFAAAALGAAATSALFDAMRDDDEDEYETFFEKYYTALGWNIVDNFNPFGMIPYARDMISIAQGFTVKREDMTSISNLKIAFQQLYKYLAGDSKKNLYNVIQSLASAGSQLSGIPVGNLMREFYSIYNTIATIASKDPDEMTASESFAAARTKYDIYKRDKDGSPNAAVSAVYYELLEKADAEGSKEIYDEIYAALIKSGRKPSSIASALKNRRIKRLRGDERIKQAAQYRKDKDYYNAKKLLDELIAEGFKKDEAESAITSELQELYKQEAPDPEEFIAAYKRGNKDEWYPMYEKLKLAGWSHDDLMILVREK